MTSKPPIDDHRVGLLDDEVREHATVVVLGDPHDEHNNAADSLSDSTATSDAPVHSHFRASEGNKGGEEKDDASSALQSGDPPPGTFRSTISGMLTVIMMIAATYMIPGLEWARPWTPGDPVPFWNLLGREFLGEGKQAAADDAATRDLAALALAEAANADAADADAALPDKGLKPADDPAANGDPGHARIPAYIATDDDKGSPATPVQHLENPRRLDRFYAALTRTDLRLPGAITRASHYGDSAIGNDGITGAIRAKMQARFGDAGHGFHLLGQPNSSYRHVGVRITEKSPWHHCFIIQGCRSDGHYGFGGTSFESTAGAEIRIGTAKKGTFGRRVSRFEVYYAGMPRGGNLRLQVDDDDPIKVSTLAETLEDRWHTIEVEDGAHSLSIRAAGGGKVRAYGITLEREGPGVVWDGLSQIGALTRRLLNWDKEHIRSQVAHRNPELVVLMFGGNDMNMRGTMDNYKRELTAVIELFVPEEKLPGAPLPPACLVMAPLDHGERHGQQIVTRAIVPELVEAQRQVAQDHGCAFFDTYAAMGGEGSMGRWARSEPRLGSGDLSHLSYHGHRVIGAMVFRALLDGYADFRERVEGKPLRSLAAIADHGIGVDAVDGIDLDTLLGPPASAADPARGPAAPENADESADPANPVNPVKPANPSESAEQPPPHIP